MLLGGVVICFTYGLAQVVTDDRLMARVAACAAACNPLLICTAARSLPDMPLCACLAASSWGFVAIVVGGRRESTYYWLGYVGVGLAVAVKGLPALIWLAFVWAFALNNRWQCLGIRALVHAPSMVGATVAGSFWYAAMYGIHGGEALAPFVQDQIRDRLTWSMFHPVSGFVLALGLFWGMFVPWSLPLVDVLRVQWRALCPVEPRSQQFAAFTVIWSLAVATAIACVNDFSVRYAVPWVPLLAVLLADIYHRSDAQLMAGGCGRVAFVVAGLLGFLLVAAESVCVQLELDVASVAGLLLIAAGGSTALVIGLRQKGWFVRGGCVSGLWLLIVPALMLGVQPFVLPDQGAQIAQTLRELDLQSQSIAYCGRPALGSKVRICSQGKANLHWLPGNVRQAAKTSSVLLLPQDDVVAAGIQHRILYTASHGYRDLPVGNLLRSVATGRLADFLQQNRQSMVLAV